MAITKISTPDLFDFSSLNTALQLPTGTTLERPTTASAGQWRYNTDEKYVEYYDGTTPYDATKWFQIDTEALPNPTDFNEQNFNINTYFGTGVTQTIDAKFDQAANLNGSNSSIDFTPNTPVIFPDTGGTLSFWIRANTVSTNQDIFVTSPNGGWSSPYGQIIRLASTGVMQLYQYSTTGGNALTSNPLSTGSVTVNTWTHVALTYAGNSTGDAVKFYLNGSPDGNTTLSADSPMGTSSNNMQVRIGYRNDAGVQNPYDGAIDQVRIYNTALSDADIASLWSDETATTASSLNFPSGQTAIATYQFNGDASDLSGNYNGTAISVGYTGLQFPPDMVWIKNRVGNQDHVLFDSVRGVQKVIRPNTIDNEFTGSGGAGQDYLSAFNSNGFTVGDATNVGGSSGEYVAWCFKAGGAPDYDNSEAAGQVPTPGSVKIDDSDLGTALAGTTAATRLSANTKAGFSIVKFPVTNTSIQVAHGLDSEPELIIWKNLTTDDNWYVYNKNLTSPTTQYLRLNEDTAETGSSPYSFSAVTSTTFTSYLWNGSATNNIIAYCFANKNGYQRVGTYTGNNSTYGEMVYTTSDGTATGTDGFEPAFLLVKRTDTGGTGNWRLYDNKRNTINPRNCYLNADTNSAGECQYTQFNFYSNGFQAVGTDTSINASGATMLYLAIGSNPAPTPTATNSFKPVTYSGNSSTQTIMSPNVTPSLLWIKELTGTASWRALDRNKGGGVMLFQNSTAGYDPSSGTDSSYPRFQIDGDDAPVPGFYLPGADSNGAYNYCSWMWEGSRIPTINNTGTITSIVNANKAAGFSTAIYKGDGNQNATVGHGLDDNPSLIFIKRTDTANAWFVPVPTVGTNEFMELSDAASTTDADLQYSQQTGAIKFDSAAPSAQINANGGFYIMYSFANVAGIQKIGTYTASGTSDFDVNVGFTPSFVLIKKVTNTGNWSVSDSARSTGTLPYAVYRNLYLDSNSQEGVSSPPATNAYVEYRTNGFGWTASQIAAGTNPNYWESGQTFIYLAIK